MFLFYILILKLLYFYVLNLSVQRENIRNITNSPFDNDKVPLTLLSNYNSIIGYNSYLEQIAPQKCFFWSAVEYGAISESFNSLIQFLSTPQILEKLNMVEQLKSIHFLLEETKLSKYLNLIQEEVYSVTLNYLGMQKETAKYTYILNSLENYITKNGIVIKVSNTNEEFLNICGNSLITTFDWGKAIIYSIKIIFHNSKDKRIFYSKSNINLREGDQIHFLKILQKIRVLLFMIGISEVKFEIYGIQLGGDYNNEIINNAMKINSFLIANCTSYEIFPCLEIFPNLEQYFHNFTSEDLKQQKTILLESFTYMKITEEKLQDLFYANKQLYIKSQLLPIKFYNKSIDHIIKNYPIFIEELNLLGKEIKEQTNLIFKENNLLNCYRNTNQDNKCEEKVFHKFDLIAFTTKIINLLNKKSKETVFTSEFKKGSCLPSNLEWENRLIIQTRFLDSNVYITNNVGMNCSMLTFSTFNCFDGINYLNFSIAEDDQYDVSFLVCRNKYFPKMKHYCQMEFSIEENPYLADLKDFFK